MNTMACPSGSGFQASPETPSDLRPTGVDPSRGWRPIITAPRDGRLLLLCVAGYNPTIGKWCSNVKRPCWVPFDPDDMFEHAGDLEDYLVGSSYLPTHWQPCPASSSTTSAESPKVPEFAHRALEAYWMYNGESLIDRLLPETREEMAEALHSAIRAVAANQLNAARGSHERS